MIKNYKSMILAAFFTGLTILGAFLRIPLPLVPISLQVLMVLLSGLLLSPKAAFLSQGAYLLLGLAGLPIFVGGGGFAYVLSPTFGYTLAFPLASWAVSVLSKFSTKPGFFSDLWAAFCGVGIIYLLGALTLYVNLAYLAGQGISLMQTLKVGVLSFIIPDFLKALAAAVLAKKIKEYVPLF